ncbi:MAG: DUF2232 domain-containing protein [Cellulosilyticum sp.]|nr:DUF2232 domain-containing protein [Cellulosilyticum sp.]
MEEDKKNVIKLIGIMLIYILLSALGVFGQMGVVLFPIVGLPFALYCMKNTVSKKLHVLFHVVVSIAIYLVMHSILGVLIYLVSVVIPAYVILFLYKQELALPNIMMYGGLILSAVVFVYFALMKNLGLDFEAQFAAMLDSMNQEFAVALDQLGKMGNVSGVSAAELQTSIVQLKEMMSASLNLLKSFYPAIVVSQIVMCFVITLLILNPLVRRKNKALPYTKQIFEFRLSKMAVLLLVLSMLLSDVNTTSSGAILVLALNLMSFLANLFEIVGALSFIALLSRTGLNGGVKVLGYVVIVMLFMISPYLLMFFGCLDAIFNYRKVSIVV